MKQKIVKLTGKPVSCEMLGILERLDRKENVSIDEIEAAQEMKTAHAFVAYGLDTSERKGRDEIQEAIHHQMMAIGSAVRGLDNNVCYNGTIEQGCRLDIVIGLSASGKSSALADTLSEEFHSRVVDNDVAKTMIPEFNNGWGAGVVHKELQAISDQVYRDALKNHDNIVLPKVGSNYQKLLRDYIEPAKEEGYEVNLHFVDLDRNKAMGRLLNRYIETGRFLDPRLIDKYAPSSENNKVAETYEVLKSHEYIHGSSKWDNDVPRGSKPILLEYRNLNGEFIRNAVMNAKGDDHNEHRSQERMPAHMRNNGGSGRGIPQDGNVDAGAQRRSIGIDSEREAPYSQYSESYPSVIGRIRQNECGRTPGIMGTTGEVDDTEEIITLTEGDLKGTEPSNDMAL